MIDDHIWDLFAFIGHSPVLGAKARSFLMCDYATHCHCFSTKTTAAETMTYGACSQLLLLGLAGSQPFGICEAVFAAQQNCKQAEL